MEQIKRNKSTEHQFTAFIDHYLDFSNYLSSYKQSFDILLNDVVKTNSHVDYIAYPILFIARHCIELGLKTNIRYFSKYSGKEDYVNSATHDLENLFKAFKMHLEKTFIQLKTQYSINVEKNDKKAIWNLFNDVQKLSFTLHKLDKKSDSFRYPVDLEKNPSFENGDRINILDVAELLEKSIQFFFYTADVLSNYTNYADEIDAYYDEQMRDQL